MVESKNSKKYFITYGSEDYVLQKKHLINLVRKSNYFDEQIPFGPKDLSSEFKSKFSDILKVQRGGGYWIWKCEILNRMLEKVNHGDYIVYSSAGSTFNKLGLERLDYYFDLLNSSESGNLRFQLTNHLEKNWTTKEIFKYFNIDVDSEIGNSEQLIANHFIIRKNKVSIDIFKEFEKLIYNEPDLITDNNNSNGQIPTFRENRHDQSIFSILSKIYGHVAVDKDETFFLDNPLDQFDYPFLSSRKRKYTVGERILFYLLYPLNVNKPKYFKYKKSIVERVIYKISVNMHIYFYKK